MFVCEIFLFSAIRKTTFGRPRDGRAPKLKTARKFSVWVEHTHLCKLQIIVISPFRVGLLLVGTLLPLISATAMLLLMRDERKVASAEDTIFSMKSVAGSMLLPLVAPFSAILRSSTQVFRYGWKGEEDGDEQDKRPPRRPFRPFSFWDFYLLMDADLYSIDDELALYAEHLSPFAETKEVIENEIVLVDVEFVAYLKASRSV